MSQAKVLDIRYALSACRRERRGFTFIRSLSGVKKNYFFMVKAAKRRSVSSVSVRSGRETGKTKVVAAVVGAHGARDGRAVERAEGAAGAEGRRATAQDDAQAEFLRRVAP